MLYGIDDASLKIDQDTSKNVSPNVKSDRVRCVWIDIKAYASSPSCAWASSCFEDDAVFDEVSDNIGDCGWGEARQPRHLGPGDVVMSTDCLEDSPPIVGARVSAVCSREHVQVTPFIAARP